GMVLVVDPLGGRVFGSAEVQRLSNEAKDTLRVRLHGLRQDQERFSITLDQSDFSFVAQRVRAGAREVFAVAVGEAALDPGVALQRLGASLLVVLPIIVSLAALVGWTLANRALRPVGRMIDELEEITDGRSLHRRLPAAREGVADELARLA